MRIKFLNINISIHSNQKRFYKYWYIKRLTLNSPDRPAIYRWLFFVFCTLSEEKKFMKKNN